MITYQYQPLGSWNDFEHLCRDLFEHEWSSRVTNLNGRNGSRQKGVDIYGYPNNKQQLYGVQCKGKEIYPEKAISIDEIKNEIAKALQFTPRLTHFIFATTARRNVAIQEQLREYLNESNLLPFTVAICFWDDIEAKLNQYVHIATKFYPNQQNNKRSLIERAGINDRVNIVSLFDSGNGSYDFNCQYYNLNGSFDSKSFNLRFGEFHNLNNVSGKQIENLTIPFNKICHLIEEFFYGEIVESFSLYFHLEGMWGDLRIKTSEASISGSYHIKDGVVQNDEYIPADSYKSRVFIELVDICKSIQSKLAS
ncbi:restriction endonuclease [Pseudoalteromonas phenolica]|uniref:restriction endonuclease n=1 Tax=Pseudoalteromonas phenolica TaxID=161398 RepID=UPI00110BCD19|nr:restriction endonuclease [Pseudoalteromonas phenolica]TMO57107.1 hypothetical protein CWC21_04270 [Pseudoalteromonas phenolica]